MRNIGTIGDRAGADKLADVLLGEGIHSQISPGSDGTVDVWVLDDAHLDAGRRLLSAWTADPRAPEIEALRAAGEARRMALNRAEAGWRDRNHAARVALYGADGRGWVTLSVLAIVAAVAGVSRIGSDLQPIDALFLTSLPPWMMLPEVRVGQVWRLVTPMFIHFGVMHLLFNAWMWWTMAGAMETRRGGRYMLLFVLVAAVCSNLAQLAWGAITAPDIPVFVGGLSGVLYAVFGYRWINGVRAPSDGLALATSTVQAMVGWLFLCMTGMLGPIANAAHVGGLVVGVVWAWLTTRPRPKVRLE
jgi:GlpG protein